MQSVFPMVGDEIVFVLSADSATSAAQKIPAVIAQVLPGRTGGADRGSRGLARRAVQGNRQALIGFRFRRTPAVGGSESGPGRIRRTLRPTSRNVISRVSAGSSRSMSPICRRALAHQSAHTALDAKALKYLFFEQRAAQGVEENRATFAFNGARTGLASWIASKGAGRSRGVHHGRTPFWPSPHLP